MCNLVPLVCGFSGLGDHLSLPPTSRVMTVEDVVAVPSAVVVGNWTWIERR